MITLALRLLKTKAGLGLALSVGILLAVGSAYRLGVWRGVRDGIATERAAWSSEVALARTSATASQVAADAATSALRDSLRTSRAETAEMREKLALSRGKYHEALGWYRASVAARDTAVPITPEQRVCDEVVSSCTMALAAEEATRAALTAQLLKTERLVTVQDSLIRTEPARTTLTVREMLAQQRAAFRGPSRVRWGATGAVLGAVGAWLVLR